MARYEYVSTGHVPSSNAYFTTFTVMKARQCQAIRPPALPHARTAPPNGSGSRAPPSLASQASVTWRFTGSRCPAHGGEAACASRALSRAAGEALGAAVGSWSGC